MRCVVEAVWSTARWNLAAFALSIAIGLAPASAEPVQGKGQIAATPVSLESPDPAMDSPRHEFGNARSDHEAVVRAVARCLDLGDPLTWSGPVRAAFFLGLTKDFTHAQPDRPTPGVAAGSVKLTPLQAGAVYFSDKISRERAKTAIALDDSRSRESWYYKLIVGVGAAVTVLAGVQTLFGRTTGASQNAVGIGTLVLGALVLAVSAASTSLSSLRSFEAGYSQPLVQERELAQLQQLHARIAIDVSKRGDFCITGKEAKVEMERVAVLDAWGARLEKILNDASISIAQPGDLVAPVRPTEKPDTTGAAKVAAASR